MKSIKIGKRGLVLLTLVIAIAFVASGALMTFLLSDTETVTTSQKTWYVKRQLDGGTPPDVTWMEDPTGAEYIPATMGGAFSLEPDKTQIIYFVVWCALGEGIDTMIFTPTATVSEAGLTAEICDWAGTPVTTVTGETYSTGERALFAVHITADPFILAGTTDVDIDLGLPVAP